MVKPHAHKGPAGTCTQCGWTMCWQGEGTPETRLRRKEGWCMRCWRDLVEKPARGEQAKRPPAEPRPDTSYEDMVWMNAYVADRRRRHVHPNGVAMDGEKLPRHIDAWELPKNWIELAEGHAS